MQRYNKKGIIIGNFVLIISIIVLISLPQVELVDAGGIHADGWILASLWFFDKRSGKPITCYCKDTRNQPSGNDGEIRPSGQRISNDLRAY